MATNDNRSSADKLDQYYTRLDVAVHFFGVLQRYFDPASFQMVEPSAGDGAFFRLTLPGSLGYDLEPKYAGIRTADFLEVTVGGDRPICIVGNPPFGQNSSMAVKFFNHAAREASVIAMIFPSTFRKGSIQNRLDPAFHVLYQETVPKDAFRFEGRLHNVPATFMIWERRTEPRNPWPTMTQHPDFDFLTNSQGADFLIQRVGARAGQVHDNFSMSPRSHYFIKANRYNVRAVMEQLDLAAVARNVAGCPSISKCEIVSMYCQWVDRQPGT
ncbi:SAM-dependent methyltransferase [Sphingomonas koreensis]|nr:SAM-dependent methyltransferase [Sphingomonas koreensis]